MSLVDLSHSSPPNASDALAIVDEYAVLPLAPVSSFAHPQKEMYDGQYEHATLPLEPTRVLTDTNSINSDATPQNTEIESETLDNGDESCDDDDSDDIVFDTSFLPRDENGNIIPYSFTDDDLDLSTYTYTINVTYRCKVCFGASRRYPDRTDLIYDFSTLQECEHHRLHTHTTLSFSKTICCKSHPKVKASVATLTAHENLIHRRYTCRYPSCPGVFRSQSTFKDHMLCHGVHVKPDPKTRENKERVKRKRELLANNALLPQQQQPQQQQTQQQPLSSLSNVRTSQLQQDNTQRQIPTSDANIYPTVSPSLTISAQQQPQHQLKGSYNTTAPYRHPNIPLNIPLNVPLSSLVPHHHLQQVPPQPSTPSQPQPQPGSLSSHILPGDLTQQITARQILAARQQPQQQMALPPQQQPLPLTQTFSTITHVDNSSLQPQQQANNVLASRPFVSHSSSSSILPSDTQLPQGLQSIQVIFDPRTGAVLSSHTTELPIQSYPTTSSLTQHTPRGGAHTASSSLVGGPTISVPGRQSDMDDPTTPTTTVVESNNDDITETTTLAGSQPQESDQPASATTRRTRNSAVATILAQTQAVSLDQPRRRRRASVSVASTSATTVGIANNPNNVHLHQPHHTLQFTMLTGNHDTLPDDNYNDKQQQQQQQQQLVYHQYNNNNNNSTNSSYQQQQQSYYTHNTSSVRSIHSSASSQQRHQQQQQTLQQRPQYLPQSQKQSQQQQQHQHQQQQQQHHHHHQHVQSSSTGPGYATPCYDNDGNVEYIHLSIPVAANLLPSMGGGSDTMTITGSTLTGDTTPISLQHTVLSSPHPSNGAQFGGSTPTPTGPYSHHVLSSSTGGHKIAPISYPAPKPTGTKPTGGTNPQNLPSRDHIFSASSTGYSSATPSLYGGPISVSHLSSSSGLGGVDHDILVSQVQNLTTDPQRVQQYVQYTNGPISSSSSGSSLRQLPPMASYTPTHSGTSPRHVKRLKTIGDDSCPPSSSMLPGSIPQPYPPSSKIPSLNSNGSQQQQSNISRQQPSHALSFFPLNPPQMSGNTMNPMNPMSQSHIVAPNSLQSHFVSRNVPNPSQPFLMSHPTNPTTLGPFPSVAPPSSSLGQTSFQALSYPHHPGSVQSPPLSQLRLPSMPPPPRPLTPPPK